MCLTSGGTQHKCVSKGSDGQSGSKLLDAVRHRIQNLRAIKAFIMLAVLLANLNAGVLIIAKTGAN